MRIMVFLSRTRGIIILCMMGLLALSVRLPAQPGENTLRCPPFTMDGLLLVEGARQLLANAKADGVRPTPDGKGVELSPGAASGSLTLAPIVTSCPFNEAIPSWNGWAPPEGGFRVSMRAGTKAGFSPWFEAGTWGAIKDEIATRTAVMPEGYYDIDTLHLMRPATIAEVRIDLARQNPEKPSPLLRLFALSYTNSMGDKKLFSRFGDNRPQHSAALDELRSTFTLNLPFRTQVVPNAKWIGRICSPASVAVAVSRFGPNVSTNDMAEILYDPVADIFGAWHRSVQGAAQKGLRGYIQRFRNWDDVIGQMRKGAVICASIRFDRSEVVDPPVIYRKRGTRGHLLVLNGLAPGGRIIVNDSASKDTGHNSVWQQDDFARIWFDKGGVAYVFTGRADGASKTGRSLPLRSARKQNNELPR